MWTKFMDMYSGGGWAKEPPYEYIYIEAPKKEAIVIFYNRFKHNPERVTCTCCGVDYSISEYETLKQATGYDRGCSYDKVKGYYVEEVDKHYRSKEYQTLERYKKQKDILIIPAEEIKPEERKGTVPAQGYVWVD